MRCGEGRNKLPATQFRPRRCDAPRATLSAAGTCCCQVVHAQRTHPQPRVPRSILQSNSGLPSVVIATLITGRNPGWRGPRSPLPVSPRRSTGTESPRDSIHIHAGFKKSPKGKCSTETSLRLPSGDSGCVGDPLQAVAARRVPRASLDFSCEASVPACKRGEIAPKTQHAAQTCLILGASLAIDPISTRHGFPTSQAMCGGWPRWGARARLATGAMGAKLDHANVTHAPCFAYDARSLDCNAPPIIT